MRRWSAKWIWVDEQAGRNLVAYFRKSFQWEPTSGRVLLHITADSRYVAYVNGERVGHGPARCFPERQAYDSYDVTGLLRPGRNCLAVLVQHFGESNFQYLVGRPGLLAELELVGQSKPLVASRASWRGLLSPSYERRTPRISCQQAFVEHFDAGREPIGWRETDFDDSAWQPAAELGPAGMEPWKELVPREIPFLTAEPVYPVGVSEIRAVSPLPYYWCLGFASNLLPGVLDSNIHQVCGLLATEIIAPKAAAATLYRLPFAAARDHQAHLNGREVDWKGGPAHVRLRKGSNLLLLDVTGIYHRDYVGLALDSKNRLDFRAPTANAQGAAWATVGPFASRDSAEYKKARKARSRQELEAGGWPLRVMSGIDDTVGHVYGMTTLSRQPPRLEVKVESTEALCHDNSEETLISPGRKNQEVELLIDFGREVVGWLEFEVEGPEGVVLDWHGFEAIQEGRRIYPAGLQNTLRYVTRRGRQQYWSLVRRGLRYVTLTVRNLSAPLRIRFVRCRLNTYPVTEQGEFRSSDFLLNRIWELGRWTTQLCMEDTFVDCPAYEQTFWVGDARNEALVNYAAFGDLALPARCWVLAAESLSRSPLVESHVPSGWRNLLPAWSLLWMIGCQDHYLYSGDLEFARAIYPALKRQAQALEARISPRGLLRTKAWNMLDWAPMDTPEDGEITHNNAWLVRALQATAELARELKREAEATHFLEVAQGVKRAINRHLWSEKHSAYLDCLHADGSPSQVVSEQTNTVVWLCDCAPAGRRELIARYIGNPPPGWVQTGSPFAMFFVFEALAGMGKIEQILELTREKWGFMLQKGATTCWETFPGFFSDTWTRSHCHAWSAGPTYFLSRYLLGVRPAAAGFREVVIAPEPVGMNWCQGRFPTPLGAISVSWERRDDGFALELEVPREIAGQIQLPAAQGRGRLLINGKLATRQELPSPFTGLARREGRVILNFRHGGKWNLQWLSLPRQG